MISWGNDGKNGVQTLVCDFGVQTLVCDFGVQTLVCDFGVQTLVCEFGVQTLVCEWHNDLWVKLSRGNPLWLPIL